LKKKITILCSDDYHHFYLLNYFNTLFDVNAVIEPAKAQLAGKFSKKRYTDYFYSLYHKVRRSLLGLNRQRRNYFKFDGQSNFSNYILVNNINSSIVADKIREASPDVVIVICTSIIRGELLQLIKGKAINIHGGYLPYYRGNHCFFFAMYNNDFDKIGSTIHFINEGIDTGDIIEHCVPVITKKDTPESLYCRCDKSAIHRLAEILIRYPSVDDIPRAKQLHRYKLYKTKDRGLIKELIFKYKRLFHSRVAGS